MKFIKYGKYDLEEICGVISELFANNETACRELVAQLDQSFTDTNSGKQDNASNIFLTLIQEFLEKNIAFIKSEFVSLSSEQLLYLISLISLNSPDPLYNELERSHLVNDDYMIKDPFKKLYTHLEAKRSLNYGVNKNITSYKDFSYDDPNITWTIDFNESDSDAMNQYSSKIIFTEEAIEKLKELNDDSKHEKIAYEIAFTAVYQILSNSNNVNIIVDNVGDIPSNLKVSVLAYCKIMCKLYGVDSFIIPEDAALTQEEQGAFNAIVENPENIQSFLNHIESRYDEAKLLPLFPELRDFYGKLHTLEQKIFKFQSGQQNMNFNDIKRELYTLYDSYASEIYNRCGTERQKAIYERFKNLYKILNKKEKSAIKIQSVFRGLQSRQMIEQKRIKSLADVINDLFDQNKNTIRINNNLSKLSLDSYKNNLRQPTAKIARKYVNAFMRAVNDFELLFKLPVADRTLTLTNLKNIIEALNTMPADIKEKPFKFLIEPIMTQLDGTYYGKLNQFDDNTTLQELLDSLESKVDEALSPKKNSKS